MQLYLSLFYLVGIYISYVHTQIIYECNFDTSTTSDNCFTTTITVGASAGIAGTSPPTGPQSDVTASLKPTTNGEVCMLPYKAGTFTWDMYFCYRNACPTANNPSSQCIAGKFGYALITADRAFQIKTSTDGINGIGEQCLTYYYYMPPNSQTPLRVDKQEKSGAGQTIDSVTGSPINGWVRRQATFTSNEFGYKIIFNLQKPPSGVPNIAFDEISIRQGSCDDQPVTSTTTPIPVQTTTTSIPVQTSTTPISSETTTSIATQTTETNPIPVETTITSIQMDTTTTISIPVQTTETTPVTQSTTTTPVISTTTTTMEIATISTTTTPIFETSYSDKVTTQEPIKSSTTSPIILTTTVTTTKTFPVEISTAQFSPSTTTPISISSATSTISTTSIPMETTSTTTFPFTVSSTTTPTIRTSSITTTLSTTATPVVENVIISSYDETLPRDKNHTIIIATVIPIVWIAFIAALIWVRRSTGVLGGLFHPFNNFSRDGEASSTYELNDVSEA